MVLTRSSMWVSVFIRHVIDRKPKAIRYQPAQGCTLWSFYVVFWQCRVVSAGVILCDIHCRISVLTYIYCSPTKILLNNVRYSPPTVGVVNLHKVLFPHVRLCSNCSHSAHTVFTYIRHCSPTLCIAHIRYTLLTYIKHCSPTLYCAHIRYTLLTYIRHCLPTLDTAHRHYTLLTYVTHCSPTLDTVYLH